MAKRHEEPRTTADWENDEPIGEDLLQRLYHALEQKYPGRVRRALLVCPVAVEKVIDNAADAHQTLENIRRAAGAQP